MNVKIEQSWKEKLADEFEKDYFIRLTEFVRNEYKTQTIYPPGPYIFNAFEHCPFDKVKIHITNQDRHMGYAFPFKTVCLFLLLCRIYSRK